MDAGHRPGADDLSHHARLRRSPGDYHLFLALRILEAHHSDAPRLGTARRPRQEPVRLGQDPDLAFPRTTLTGFAPAPRSGRMRLGNLAFGLFGPQGPLPLHLTEYAAERKRRHRDTAFIAFCDILTHRMMGLFYRAWATGQPAPSLDRAGADPWASKVAALTGHAGPAMAGRDAMPDLAKRHFAGHLSDGAKSAEALVAMLQAFFAAPVRLQQFVGSWLTLEPDDRWQLGAPAGLGRSTSIGGRVWSRAAKFRLRIGPLGLEEYRRLLPGGGALERLEAIVRNHVGDALDWDVNLVLRAADVPRTALGGASAALGHTTWIGMRRDGAGDADDLHLTPPHRRRPAAPGFAQPPLKETVT